MLRFNDMALLQDLGGESSQWPSKPQGLIVCFE